MPPGPTIVSQRHCGSSSRSRSVSSSAARPTSVVSAAATAAGWVRLPVFGARRAAVRSGSPAAARLGSRRRLIGVDPPVEREAVRRRPRAEPLEKRRAAGLVLRDRRRAAATSRLQPDQRHVRLLVGVVDVEPGAQVADRRLRVARCFAGPGQVPAQRDRRPGSPRPDGADPVVEFVRIAELEALEEMAAPGSGGRGYPLAGKGGRIAGDGFELPGSRCGWSRRERARPRRRRWRASAAAACAGGSRPPADSIARRPLRAGPTASSPAARASPAAPRRPGRRPAPAASHRSAGPAAGRRSPVAAARASRSAGPATA